MRRFIKPFNHLKINSKLMLLTSLFILILIALAVGAKIFSNPSKMMALMINQEMVHTKTFEHGINDFYKYILTEDEDLFEHAMSSMNQANQMALGFAKIDSILSSLTREEWIAYFYNIYKEGFNYDIKAAAFMGDQIKLFQFFDPGKLNNVKKISSQVYKKGDAIRQLCQSFQLNKSEETLAQIEADIEQIRLLTIDFSAEIYSISNLIDKLLSYGLVFSVILLGFLSFLLSRKISRSISRPINQLADNFKIIATGNLGTSVEINQKNEIGELSKAFSEIQKGMQNIVSYSKHVSQGNFNLKVKPKSKDDELSISLNKMAITLKKAQKESETDTWRKNGINDLNNSIRGDLTVRELSDKILQFLTTFLGAELGALYSYDSEFGHLELTGSSGIELKSIDKILQIGEGLIGQVAKNKKRITSLTKGKYHKIYSSSGEIIPHEIHVIPLISGNQTMGVIELAAITNFSENKIDFLDGISEILAINIDAAVSRFRTNALLKKSQEQANELQTQQSVLKNQVQENKKMQDQLVWEKSLLDSLLNTLPDSVYFKDLESKFIKVSKSLYSAFGLKNADEMYGKSDFDFHPLEHAKKAFADEQQIIKTKEHYIGITEKKIDKTGKLKYSSTTKLPLLDKNGEVIGTFGISRNITALKTLENEIKEHNKTLIAQQEELEKRIQENERIQKELEWEKSLLDSLLNTLPDTVYYKDLESKFIKVSKSMADLFGVEKADDLYGKSDFDFQDSEHARDAYEDEQRIIKTQKPIIGLVEKEVFEGKDRYVSTTKLPLKTSSGEVIGTFGISRDITDIKSLEIAIKQRNEELQAQQEELRVANEEMQAQQEELRVSNEELAEHSKILAENEKSLQLQQEELRVSNEELEERTTQLELQKKEISEKNTDLLNVQENLKQKARELEIASQYKSEFLANMSHELRTPLNSMLILSKMLGNNKKGNLLDDQVKSVNIIYKSGSDLLQLINEILDLSKIEAGKMTIELGHVSTDDIKTEITHYFQPLAEHKKLYLELNIETNFPKVLYTDRQRMMQIIRNLLSNAFKFTKNGGIKINFGLPASDTVFLNKTLNPNNSYFISVIDSGVGIPQSKKEAIFDAFQQADGSISRKFGGTGLGLSISKELIRLLNGEIRVESQEGFGSEFTIYMPLATDGQPAPEITAHKAEQPAAPSQKNEKPIVIEKPKNPVKIPVFIPDDRNKASNKILVLIIHPGKTEANKLYQQCHSRDFNALVSKNIVDGILMAEKYFPKAILLSSDSKAQKDFELLKQNKYTSQLPIHLVSRIEDENLESLEELKTTDSEDIKKYSEKIANQFGGNYNTILIVEDDPVTRESIHSLLSNDEILIEEAETGNEAYNLLKNKNFECVILDLGLPDMSGKELLTKLKSDKIKIPNIIIHTARELTEKEHRELSKFSTSIVIKGIKSDERLMDEVTLFLHQLTNTLPKTIEKLDATDLAKTQFKGKKILIVDDDIRNLFALAQILEEKEIEVIEAENGVSAIEILKENKNIDLILMDIMMPEMNGYEAMEIIRKTPGISEIPIITVTAKAMKEDYQKALNYGANDYISKPVDELKLFSLLKIWLFKK